MKIKCSANNASKLPNDWLPTLSGYRSDMDFPLSIGKIYTVYAFTIRTNYIWYYILDDNNLYYPTWTPSPLFSIVNSRLSKFWEFNFIPKDLFTIVAFPEWARNPVFYDYLTDGREEYVKVFEHYKALMDQENESTNADEVLT